MGPGTVALLAQKKTRGAHSKWGSQWLAGGRARQQQDYVALRFRTVEGTSTSWKRSASPSIRFGRPPLPFTRGQSGRAFWPKVFAVEMVEARENSRKRRTYVMGATRGEGKESNMSNKRGFLGLGGYGLGVWGRKTFKKGQYTRSPV